MQQSQHDAVINAMRRGARPPADQSVLLPPKRLRSNSAGSHGSVATTGDAPPPPPDPNSPFLILRVRRAHLVDDSLDALAQQTRKSLLRPLRVIFEGEPAIDEGGVRKEFFQCLVEQLFNPDFGMFEWCEETRVFWFSRTSRLAEAEAEFFLVGLVLGLAIYNGVILDLRLPHLLWRRLMNEPVGFMELRQVQPDLWRGLRSLLEYDGDVETAFMADFAIETDFLGHTQLTELVPGGADVPVTNANRQEYVAAYSEHLLGSSVAPQFAAFQKGFLLLCDGIAFSFLSPLELEELVSM